MGSVVKKQSKTGGGSGTNQYKVRGRARSERIRNLLFSVRQSVSHIPAYTCLNDMPWTGPARKAWLQIMDAHPDVWMPSDHVLQGVLERRRLARVSIMSQLASSPEMVGYLLGQQKRIGDTIPKVGIWIDIALTVAPEAVNRHLAALVPQWPINHDAVEIVTDLSHPNYPPILLDLMAKFQMPEIRIAVASHPNCPDDTLHRLWADSHTWVRHAAIKNPKTPEHVRVITALGTIIT